MSTIGSTPPGLNTPGLDTTGGQLSFDAVRQQGLLRSEGDVAGPDAAPAPLVDPGETLLNLSAWQGVDGMRTLPRFEGFASQLAQLERSEAANAGVDGILSAG